MGLSAPYDNMIVPGGGAGGAGGEPSRAPIHLTPSTIDGGLGGERWVIVLAITVGFMVGMLVGIFYTVTFT